MMTVHNLHKKQKKQIYQGFSLLFLFYIIQNQITILQKAILAMNQQRKSVMFAQLQAKFVQLAKALQQNNKTIMVPTIKPNVLRQVLTHNVTCLQQIAIITLQSNRQSLLNPIQQLQRVLTNFQEVNETYVSMLKNLIRWVQSLTYCDTYQRPLIVLKSQQVCSVCDSYISERRIKKLYADMINPLRNLYVNQSKRQKNSDSQSDGQITQTLESYKNYGKNYIAGKNAKADSYLQGLVQQIIAKNDDTNIFLKHNQLGNPIEQVKNQEIVGRMVDELLRKNSSCSDNYKGKVNKLINFLKQKTLQAISVHQNQLKQVQKQREQKATHKKSIIQQNNQQKKGLQHTKQYYEMVMLKNSQLEIQVNQLKASHQNARRSRLSLETMYRELKQQNSTLQSKINILISQKKKTIKAEQKEQIILKDQFIQTIQSHFFKRKFDKKLIPKKKNSEESDQILEEERNIVNDIFNIRKNEKKKKKSNLQDIAKKNSYRISTDHRAKRNSSKLKKKSKQGIPSLYGDAWEPLPMLDKNDKTTEENFKYNVVKTQISKQDIEKTRSKLITELTQENNELQSKINKENNSISRKGSKKQSKLLIVKKPSEKQIRNNNRTSKTLFSFKEHDQSWQLQKSTQLEAKMILNEAQLQNKSPENHRLLNLDNKILKILKNANNIQSKEDIKGHNTSHKKYNSQKFFTLQDIDLFGGLNKLNQYSTPSEKSTGSKTKQISKMFLGKNSDKVLLVHQQQFLKVAANHIEKLKDFKNNNLFWSVLSLLKDPYKTITNSQIVDFEELNLGQIEQKLFVIGKYHKKHCNSLVCKHLTIFFDKIGLPAPQHQ